METPLSATASGNRVYRRQRNTPINLTSLSPEAAPSKALSSFKVAMKVVKFIRRAQNSASIETFSRNSSLYPSLNLQIFTDCPKIYRSYLFCH